MQTSNIPDITTKRLVLGLIFASFFGPFVFTIVFSLVVDNSETSWVLLFLLFTRGYANVFEILYRATLIGAPLTLVLGFATYKFLGRFKLYGWRIYAVTGATITALIGLFFIWYPLFAPNDPSRSYGDLEVIKDIAIFLVPFAATGTSIATFFWFIAIRPALTAMPPDDIEDIFT